MTREEAIRQLDGADIAVLNRDFFKFNQAIIMAISARRQQDVTDKYGGKMTNAQKIRAMSDEELAEFLFNGDVEYCHAGMCKAGETCRICCLKWLQQPAGEEDKHDAD